MKRRVALLMAAVLAFGAGFSSYAAQSETIPQVSQEDAGSSSEAVDNAESGGTGAGGDTKAAPGNIDTAGDPSGAGSTDTAGDSSAAGGTGTAGEPSVPGANGTTGEPSVPDSTGTAEDPSAGSTEGETAGEESPQGTQTESGVPSAAIGQVEVRIGAALILKRDVTFRVMLKDAAGNAWGEDRFIKIGGDGSATPDTGSVCFQGLPEGRYTLTVSGEGFATYTQELSVSGKESVELMTGFLGGMNYATGAAHPGVLLIGDVTGEGIVNEGDRKALMEVIEGVEGASYP